MKKFILTIAIAAIFAGCAGKTEQTEEPAVTPEVTELEQTSKTISDEAEALEAQADSLMNNL
jgi:PBP1b-binding outer membrane lipoprotein LpoB